MTKGRNTAVVSVRLPDDIISHLKQMAKHRRQSMTELLTPQFKKMVDEDIKKQRLRQMKQTLPEIPESYSIIPEEPEISMFKGVGRNEPCPCGSGLKYKKCHGK